MVDFTYFILFFTIFSLAVILFFLIKKDQEKKIKEYFFKKKTMSDDSLELISTYEIIKELKVMINEGFKKETSFLKEENRVLK